jgi:hypothetical protein
MVDPIRNFVSQISGCNLGLSMRLLAGFGTLRHWADAKIAIIWLYWHPDSHTAVFLGLVVLIVGPDQPTILGIEVMPLRSWRHYSATGCYMSVNKPIRGPTHGMARHGASGRDERGAGR